MSEKPIFLITNFEAKDVQVVKQNGEDFLEFSGHGAVFDNIDLQDDIIRKGAFESATAKKTKLLLMHSHRSVPLGIFTELKEDDKGLFVTGRMPMADDRVKGMVAPQMRLGSLNSMSVGFMSKDFSFETVGKGQNARRIRIITKVELFEISLVTFPANPKARVTAVKDYLKHLEDDNDIDLDKEKNMSKLLEDLPKNIVNDVKFDTKTCIASIKAETKSLEEPSSEYGKCFLWHDEKNADMFSSYKMPIAQKIDGELSINFKAVVAAVTAIQRGEFDIPESDTETIKRNINRIYEKAGENPPFTNKAFCIGMAELKYSSKADLEFLLKNFNFKSNTAKAAVSSLYETFTEKDSRDGDASEKDDTKNDRDGEQNCMNRIVECANELTQ